VGDDAQSIYAFRGADIRNILDFNRDYPEALTIRLEQNYRSTQNILAAANQVISRNVDQIAKTIWTENARGDEITVLACQDDRDEGASVVRSIFEETRRTGKEFRDFAVMYRTNAQSRSLEDALRRSSIPYVIVGGVEFYQRKEVKDVLAYIRLLVNPRDEESFLRVINTPVRGLGDTAVERLRKFAESRGLGLYDSLAQLHESEDLKARALTAFGEFFALIEKYRRLRGEMSASEVSRTLVDELGILRRYKDEGTPEALARWENVQELLSAITEFTTIRDGATLEDFLQDVSLVSDIDTYDAAANAVTLMTLHSAKGLEFPVVFLTGLEEGLLPFYSSSPDRKDLEEERRLCYVGMTRAKLKLYMSWARMRFRFAEMSYQSPSRFLEEIEPDLIRTSHSIRPAISPEAQRRTAPAVSPYRKREKTDPDSHYYRDTLPDDDDAQVPVSHFKAGKIVDHETFGRGKILHVTGSGETLKAVVEFSSVGKKQLLLKYARLRVV
jgi:DNA helicase-2/ATP-dependent DNA helicase PcrA